MSAAREEEPRDGELSREEEPPDDEELLEEEEEAAAAEAARIGGDVPRDEDDPARQPVTEGGEGEAEGFELAEKDLEEGRE